MDDTAIKQQMALARVPREALATTLTKEHHPVLRAYVTDRQYVLEPLYLYPKNVTASYATDLAFSLVVKELTLQGEKVASLDLVELHSCLFKDELDQFDLVSRLQRCTVVAINGFHAKGPRSTQFLTRYEEEYIASWVVRKLAAGTRFILAGGGPILDLAEWWPARLVSTLKEKAMAYEVTK